MYFMLVSYIWGSMGNHSDSCQVCIMPDSVPKMYDTDMIYNDADMNIMDDLG